MSNNSAISIDKLSSPILLYNNCNVHTNGTNFDSERLLSKMYAGLNSCCKKGIEIVNTCTNEIVVVPQTCDLRVCECPACVAHRSKQYVKVNRDKVRSLQNCGKTILSWVFTDSVVPFDVFKEYVSARMNLCYALLKKYCTTGFSIHLEFKVHDDGFYVHFHVLAGFIRDLKEVRRVWDAQVKYEFAVFPGSVVKYVSKYAGKTPFFESDIVREFYFLLTYKFRMHRFCVTVVGVVEKPERVWVSFFELYAEIYSALCVKPFAYMNDEYVGHIPIIGFPARYEPFPLEYFEMEALYV